MWGLFALEGVLSFLVLLIVGWVVSPLDGDLVKMVGLESVGQGINNPLSRPVIRHSDEGAIPETLGGKAFRMAGDIADPVIDPHPIPERDFPGVLAGHHEDGHFLTGDECGVEGGDGGVNRGVPQLTRRRMHRPIKILRKLGRGDSFDESVLACGNIEAYS